MQRQIVFFYKMQTPAYSYFKNKQVPFYLQRRGFRRQILTSKVDPITERIMYIMAVET